MRVCWVEESAEMGKSEVLQALKQAVRERFWEGEYDPVFSLAYDREDQFFFKNIRAILWARVFFEPVTQASLTALDQEVARLRKTFRQKIRVLIIMPRSEENAAFAPDYASLCLEYFFFQAEGKKALGIRQIAEAPEAESPETVRPTVHARGEAPLLPDSRLSREELSGLIHLALELKARH